MKDSGQDGENPAHDRGDQLVVQVVEGHRLRLEMSRYIPPESMDI